MSKNKTKNTMWFLWKALFLQRVVKRLFCSVFHIFEATMKWHCLDCLETAIIQLGTSVQKLLLNWFLFHMVLNP